MSARLVGLVLVVAGIGLGLWGYQLAGSFSEQVTETLTGASSDKVMMLYIAGAVCVAAGAWSLFKR